MNGPESLVARTARYARLLADALDALPEGVPTPTHTTLYTFKTSSAPEIEWLLFGHDDDGEKRSYDEQKEIAQSVLRAVGGKWDKDPGELFGFTMLRDGVRFHISVDREAVCQRVVTGTREVTKLVPAPDAPTVEVTETVEDVEWICEPVLAERAS